MFAGLAGGVATVLANAAGPIQQLYLLSKRIPKMDMIGVGARFFLIVNIVKLPFLSQIGLVQSETLLLNLLTIPAIVAGVLVGKKILHRVPQALFEKLIVGFAAIAAVRLLFF